MPQSGGVVAPRARRRRPAPRAFGLDLEWETGTGRTERGPVYDDAPSNNDAPWFAALPASLLAPADAPAPELGEGSREPSRTQRASAGRTERAAARAQRADRELVAEELAALARPSGASGRADSAASAAVAVASAEPAAVAVASAEPAAAAASAEPAASVAPGEPAELDLPAEPAAAEWAPVYDPVTGRRTVTIRGRGAERAPSVTPTVPRRARATAPRYERSGFVGDRAAMWAVLLGVLLVLIAVASAHG